MQPQPSLDVADGSDRDVLGANTLDAIDKREESAIRCWESVDVRTV
jgi:hypothetical protein